MLKQTWSANLLIAFLQETSTHIAQAEAMMYPRAKMRDQDSRETREVLTLGAETSVTKLTNTIMQCFLRKIKLMPKLHEKIFK